VFSLVWLVVQTVVGMVNPSPSQATPAASAPVEGRDGIAAAPMPSVDPAAAFKADPSLRQAEVLAVPAATTGRGPAGVPAGFPHTTAGAVGQLAAIEQAVLEGMDLDLTRQVHQQWVMADGPSFEEWSQTANVASFLASGAQAGQAKDATTVVTATPAAAMVKGVDGPDWAVVCVLFDVKAAIKTDSRMGYGSCARMQWSGDRWLIGSGPEPAKAPSAWPGSQAAVDAGWLTWKDE
jgi:hypothetical protein